MTLPDPVEITVGRVLAAIEIQGDNIQDEFSSGLLLGMTNTIALYLGLDLPRVQELVDFAAINDNPASYIRAQLDRLTT